ncbi:hypothetical protein ACFRFU_54745 [Streptomyces sp. NPDC056704]|uniref:hypothetical protein n=1 Tax=Streptomyces sp. NPDC056704 TaxID=3345917 RepID=UPI0036A165CA
MQVGYESNRQGLIGRYSCQRRHHTYGEPRCQQMAGRFLDDHVAPRSSARWLRPRWSCR